MQSKNTEMLLKLINSALTEKKGENLVNINFGKIENTITKYFVICTANSKIHGNTLAAFVEDFVRENQKEKPWHKEGFENSEWILLDYVDVVVHIFQEESRQFYKIEQLWADAETIKIEK
ncbi:MAG: ribosome silencing factor [Bacteroidales bacterium]|jgi:ribosome-associated protein|nr:ribosome silencing factor [Bacteroidales bacterium]